jgi:hypothetical protein
MCTIAPRVPPPTNPPADATAKSRKERSRTKKTGKNGGDGKKIQCDSENIVLISSSMDEVILHLEASSMFFVVVVVSQSLWLPTLAGLQK